MERVNILKPVDLILNLWLDEAFEEEEKDIDLFAFIPNCLGKEWQNSQNLKNLHNLHNWSLNLIAKLM